MDISFQCPECRQLLEADPANAGSQISCPVCGKPILVPAPEHEAAPAAPAAAAPPPPSQTAAPGERHFSVPVRDVPTPSLIEKPKKPLDAVVKDSDRQIRIRCIRRAECIEVGHDRFEEVVTEFLQKIGEANIISTNTVSYSSVDLGSRQILNDFGILIVYRG